jgi:type VII secretion-associated serine protease mycosin
MNNTSRRRRAVTLALALAGATLAPLLLPHAATPAAASEPCRQDIEGADMPEDAGQYALVRDLGLPQAWDLSQGDGITVAVVDAGVDASHPLLDGAVAQGTEFTTVYDSEVGYDIDRPESQRDCVGHGTAIAGIIAGRRAEGDRIAGVAPEATVYPVRVDGGSGGNVDTASVDMIAVAIDEAVARDADIINLSFAVPVDHDVIGESVADAVDAGVLVVAATGNEGNENVTGGLMYPAAYDGVLAVGAVGADGQPQDSSNAGDWVDIAAYGQEDLMVVSPGGSGYRNEGGTSMAAAQVSGAAALVWSLYPDMTAADVARRLTDSAVVVGGTHNDQTGAGIVDPYGALAHLDDAGGEAEDAASPGRIPVQAMPVDEPLLSSTAAASLAWSGVLLLGVLFTLLASPGVRRAVRRGWRAGPVPGVSEPTRPDIPKPAGRSLAWIGGDAASGPPAAPGGPRTMVTPTVNGTVNGTRRTP